MKKGVNILWVGFALLCILAIFLSQYDCIKFIPTHLEGIPINDDGSYMSIGGMSFELPEPTYYNAFEVVAIFSVICTAVFLFRNIKLNVIGNLITLIQAVFMCFLPQLKNYLEEMNHSVSCGIGEVHGYYEPMMMYFILSILCVAIFVCSVILTIVYARDRNR